MAKNNTQPTQKALCVSIIEEVEAEVRLLQHTQKSSIQICALIDELLSAMKGKAEDDISYFERSARALSTMVRTTTTIGAWAETLKEQIARDNERDEKTSTNASGPVTPQERATLDRIHFESARHLYAHADAGEDQSVARDDEV